MRVVELLPGTLDLLVLKAVSLGPEHGYGVLLRIEIIAKGCIPIKQGTLYPALYRLEKRRLLKTTWGTSDNGRRAKYYSLTAAGRKGLVEAKNQWHDTIAAMTAALRATAKSL